MWLSTVCSHTCVHVGIHNMSTLLVKSKHIVKLSTNFVDNDCRDKDAHLKKARNDYEVQLEISGSWTQKAR